MSSVKISGLPVTSNLNSNPIQSIFPTVDLTTNQTTQISAKALGNSLYANNSLIVGTGGVYLPNTVAQFTGLSGNYAQVSAQNLSPAGSIDYISTADIGTDTSYYLDMGLNNSTYSDDTFSVLKALDGYLYVQGGPAGQTANLAIGVATTNSNINFFAGGTLSQNIIMSINSNGVSFVKSLNVSSNGITFSDGTKLYSNSSIQSAYNQANTASANTVYITGGLNSANANISSLNIYANSAYAQANLANSIANTAVQNTASIQLQTLKLSGNLSTSNSFIQFNNNNFSQNNAFITITASDNYTTVAPSNTNYMLQVTGKANSVTRVVLDSFGANTYPVLVGRMGRGSTSVPAAVQSGDVLMRIVGNGYTGTTFPPSSPTKIDFVASENFTDLTRGTQIQFWNTPNGSNTLTQIATFNADSVTFNGSVKPQKGFIWNQTPYPGAQTAITIDFANNSIIRTNTTAGIVMSFSNYTVGKIVEVWITNTAGTNQTFTHGCSALNATVNSTTYNIPGTSSILARYMCFGSDVANTFVAIIK